MELPNQKLVVDIIENLSQEYDVGARLKRYSSMAPELLEFAKSEGLSSEDAASYALFVGDFIVASSEVPQGTSDEERHRAVINAFIDGLSNRSGSPEALMKTFYLAYRLAQIIRKNDLFMAGRGLEREASLSRIYDSFIMSYLMTCDRLLGPGRAGWELGVLSAALKRTLPYDEIQSFKDAPNNDNHKELVPWVWKLLNEYDLANNVRVNNNRVISNVDSSNSVLLLDKNEVLISLWNMGGKRDYKADRDSLRGIIKFTDNADFENKLIYVRGKLLSDGKEEGNIIFVRYPFSREKPFILLRTPADETNVTESMAVLSIKALQSSGWKKLSGVVIEEKQEVEIESTATSLVEKKEVKEEVVEDTDRSLIGRTKRFFKGLFKRKGTNKPSKRPEALKKPETLKKRGFVKKKEPVLSPFLAEAVTVDVVGDLKLFEMFDTFRESQYLIIGVLETDFKEDKTTIIMRSGFSSSEKIISVLNGLDEAFEKALNHYFKGSYQLLPEEIVFAHGEEERYIFNLAGNQDRIVSTIATTYIKDITKWREEEETVQRRTLQMRANQLLSSRRHTPLDASVERIFGKELSQTTMHEVTGAILKLS